MGSIIPPSILFPRKKSVNEENVDGSASGLAWKKFYLGLENISEIFKRFMSQKRQ